MRVRIPFSKFYITITIEKASQYSFWTKFRKSNFLTNPYSICKGYKCIWYGIIAGGGKWCEIHFLVK